MVNGTLEQQPHTKARIPFLTWSQLRLATDITKGIDAWRSRLLVGVNQNMAELVRLHALYDQTTDGREGNCEMRPVARMQQRSLSGHPPQGPGQYLSTACALWQRARSRPLQ